MYRFRALENVSRGMVSPTVTYWCFRQINAVNRLIESTYRQHRSIDTVNNEVDNIDREYCQQLRRRLTTLNAFRLFCCSSFILHLYTCLVAATSKWRVPAPPPPAVADPSAQAYLIGVSSLWWKRASWQPRTGKLRRECNTEQTQKSNGPHCCPAVILCGHGPAAASHGHSPSVIHPHPCSFRPRRFRLYDKVCTLALARYRLSRVRQTFLQ